MVPTAVRNNAVTLRINVEGANEESAAVDRGHDYGGVGWRTCEGGKSFSEDPVVGTKTKRRHGHAGCIRRRGEVVAVEPATEGGLLAPG